MKGGSITSFFAKRLFSVDFFLPLVILCLSSRVVAQQAILSLPEPTGPHPTGSLVWHWTDPERSMPAEGGETQPREISVQAWYPAEGGGEPASYAPHYPNGEQVEISSSRAPNPLAEDQTLPVILIGPGRGVASHFYTSLAEDLASHGYFVAAVNMPHIGRVAYPDGRVIPPSDDYALPFETLIGPYEEVDRFFEPATALGAADIEFALRRLEAVNDSDPDGRFSGRLDLDQIGAFGHSLGGRLIGEVVDRDDRFAAYASMEGVPPRQARKSGMDAAVLMMLSSTLPDIAQPNIRDVIGERRNDVYIATLGGYGHNSVTDLPLLRPEEYDYGVDFDRGMATVREILRLFYGEYLRDSSDALLRDAALNRVRLELFPAP